MRIRSGANKISRAKGGLFTSKKLLERMIISCKLPSKIDLRNSSTRQTDGLV